MFYGVAWDIGDDVLEASFFLSSLFIFCIINFEHAMSYDRNANAIHIYQFQKPFESWVYGVVLRMPKI